jgi:hypothetical protein
MATAAGAITSRIYTVTETYNTSFEVNDPKWTLSRMQRRSFRKLESQTRKTDSKKFKDTKRLQTSIAVGEQITSPIMMSRDDPGNAKLHGALEWGKEQKLNMEESKAAARAMRNLKLCEERVIHSQAQGMPYPKMVELLVELSWLEALQGEMNKPYMENLAKFVSQEAAGQIPIYPPPARVFHALNACPLDTVKVVILAQVV